MFFNFSITGVQSCCKLTQLPIIMTLWNIVKLLLLFNIALKILQDWIYITITISRIVEGWYEITGIILNTKGVSRKILYFETAPNQRMAIWVVSNTTITKQYFPGHILVNNVTPFHFFTRNDFQRYTIKFFYQI